MRRIAIIPARGGSKRIPRKNIKLFLGKPIIAYSIKAALDSGLFDTVMVSTDDEEIKSIAMEYGAEVPFLRSEKNADDHATTVDVLLEVLSTYQDLDERFTEGTCLYPTAPLVSKAALISSYKILDESDADTVITISNFTYPIERALKVDASNKIAFAHKENVLKRSQDLQTFYHDAGQFYTFNVDQLKINKTLFTDLTRAVILPNLQVQDIDTLEDWELAELKYQAIHREQN